MPKQRINDDYLREFFGIRADEEGRRELAELRGKLERMQFDHLGVFAYSAEEGTAAAKMEGRPPSKVAEARALKVMAVQKGIWARKAKAMLGKKFRALVVAPGVARLESQAPDVDGVVRLRGKAPVGEFVAVRLAEASGYDFIGEVLVGD